MSAPETLRPYPAMKDSGVPWLGEVPEHWDVKPARSSFEEVKDPNHPDEPMLSVTITKGVIRQSDLLAGSSKKDSSNLDKSKYKLVLVGDIAYNKMRAWQGAIGFSAYRGIVSPAYIVQRPRAGVSGRFVHYLLRTPKFAKEAERWSYGITSDQWSLRPEHFKMIYCCLPPPEEQAAIVRFLDHADWKIRRAIRAKQKLVKLLEEEKQAIIHRAVTRGLDPNVRLKPSGVEWLGDVPEHWGLVPNRAVMRLQKHLVGKASSEFTLLSLTKRGVIQRDMENPEGKFPTSFDTYQEVLPGDLVFCLFDIDETPRAVGLSTLHGMITGAYTRFTCDPSVVAWVCLFYLAMDNGKRLKPLYTGLRKVITKSSFLSAKLPLPPERERSQIISAVEKTVRTADKGVEKANREIVLLREYRTRLIADVVTGKLDVREAAARLPDVAPEADADDSIDATDDGDQAVEAEGDADADAEAENARA